MSGPVLSRERIGFLDLFRGFSLLGLPFVNVLGIWFIAKPDNGIDFWIQRGLYFFVEARFYDVFSFLFGLGFYLFLTRAAAKGEPKLLLYTRRLLILLGVGFIHQMFQPGEALFYYGIVGLLIIPLYWAPKLINLLIGLLGLVGTIVLGVKLLTVPFLIVLGLAAGQYRLLEKIQKGLPFLRHMLLISFLGTVAGVGWMWWAAPPEAMSPFLYETVGATLPSEEQANMDAAFRVEHIGIATGPIVSIFYLCTLLLWSQRKQFARLLDPLHTLGRMALTNYIGQTVIFVVVQRLLISSETTYLFSSLVSLGIVLFQVVASNLWMRRFQYGPLEWLWRCGTYWSFVPLLKRKTPSLVQDR